jgi:hypothetical protein
MCDFASMCVYVFERRGGDGHGWGFQKRLCGKDALDRLSNQLAPNSSAGPILPRADARPARAPAGPPC